MADRRVEQLADLLVNYSIEARPGQRIAIQGSTLAEPLIEAVYRSVLKAGAHPTVFAVLPGLEEVFFRHASDDQLQYVAAPLKLMMETYDGLVSLMGARNTKALSNVPPEKLALNQRASGEITRIFMRRHSAGELRWVGTLFPTAAGAQDATMGLAEFEDFVYGACLPDADDPIGYWKRFSARQQKLVEWFRGKKRIHVTGPDTDLRLSIEGRPFINCDGRANMPDGEVFTSPVEGSVEGTVRYTFPAVYRGREVENVRLRLEKGRVVEAKADKGEDFLLRTLDVDEGARVPGEFAIGTNQGVTRFMRNTLFDEKIAGTFHMALGASIPESGGTNVSAVHWDMVCDLRPGGEIRVDGELLHKDGKFVIEF
ncbi:MAG TPA: aminopeptidase [Candidatus Eisenbacteria bacterium]|nr:aminopeptidase [Candidatus Eisenbacteria bacterium]